MLTYLTTCCSAHFWHIHLYHHWTGWKSLKSGTFWVDALKGFRGSLTHFMPLVFFYTPWIRHKTFGFLMFSEGIERDQWHEWVNLHWQSYHYYHYSYMSNISSLYINNYGFSMNIYKPSTLKKLSKIYKNIFENRLIGFWRFQPLNPFGTSPLHLLYPPQKELPPFSIETFVVAKIPSTSPDPWETNSLVFDNYFNNIENILNNIKNLE